VARVEEESLGEKERFGQSLASVSLCLLLLLLLLFWSFCQDWRFLQQGLGRGRALFLKWSLFVFNHAKLLVAFFNSTIKFVIASQDLSNYKVPVKSSSFILNCGVYTNLWF